MPDFVQLTPPPPPGLAYGTLDRASLALSNFFAGRLTQCQAAVRALLMAPCLAGEPCGETA